MDGSRYALRSPPKIPYMSTNQVIKAEEAGLKLRSLLKPDDTLHFFTSPYRRTRETTEGILNSLTSDDPTPSPFPRHTIKVYEEPRLREQDFGNFQPCSTQMERMWQERADYGHFFYRIPDGESAADAYDRVSGFNESLWRSFGEDDFASVCVLVTHGLMTRVFLMKWYHFSVEYFEDLRNVNHCEFVVMRKNDDNGKFVLQNQLRTWSELRKERAAAAAPPSPVPVRKRWGGCPDGCDHGLVGLTRRPRRQNTAELFEDDAPSPPMKTQLEPGFNQLDSAAAGVTQSQKNPPQDPDKDNRHGRLGSPKRAVIPPGKITNSPFALATRPIRANNHLPEKLISPDRVAILQAGRDGGGSRSGTTSRNGSSDDEVEDKGTRAPVVLKRSMARALNGDFDTAESGMGMGARADALGDQSDVDDGDGEGGTELESLEAADKGLMGSVY
jgi:broad specificity phosphatase PhoE